MVGSGVVGWSVTHAEGRCRNDRGRERGGRAGGAARPGERREGTLKQRGRLGQGRVFAGGNAEGNTVVRSYWGCTVVVHSWGTGVLGGCCDDGGCEPMN